jgi:hypothetical protein
MSKAGALLGTGESAWGYGRPGALERVHLLLEEWQHAGQRLADTNARMLRVLDQLQLTALASSNPGPPSGGGSGLRIVSLVSGV